MKRCTISNIVMALSLLAGTAAAAQWESIGPDGGDRFMVRLAPGSTQTVFVAGYHAIHRSRDAGENWSLTIDPLMSNDTWTDLLFVPGNPQQLFAAGVGQGVWFSANEGDSWQQRATGLPQENGSGRYYPVTSLAALPGGTLFAGISTSQREGLPPALIYRSLNNGASWNVHSTGIVVDTNINRVATLLSVDSTTQLWAIATGYGVYQYSGGAWVNRNGNLPPAARRGTYLAHDPVNPSRILLGTESDWVYETTNGGQTWSRRPLPSELQGLAVLPLVYLVTIDPNNANLVIVRANDTNGSTEHPIFRPLPNQSEGAGLYISADGGATWVMTKIFAFRLAPVPSQVVEDLVPGLGVVRRTRTWFRTAGGRDSVLRTSDGFLTFAAKTRGLRTIWFNAVWVHPQPPAGYSELVFGGSEDGLFVRSNGVADAWSYASSAGSPVYTWSFARDYANPASVFYSTGTPSWNRPDRRGIYHIDLACFDQFCDPADNQLLTDTGVWRVVTTSISPNRLYAGTQEEGILHSADGGLHWIPLNVGISLPASITDIELDVSGNPLYASYRTNNGDGDADPPQPWPPQDGEAGGVYRAMQGTGQWVPMPGLTAAAFDLELVPGATQTLFAATSDGVYRYRTDDGWQRISASALVNDIAVDLANPQIIYAATRFGIVRTTNGGGQWQDYSDGLPVRIAYSVDWDPGRGVLYAGLEGGSIAQRVIDLDAEPEIAPSATSIDFGMVPVGFSGERALSVTNAGEASLTITNIAVAGAAGFALVDVPALPVLLTPGSWITFDVQFTPPGAGPQNGVLTIAGNATNSPVQLPLSGIGYTDVGQVSVTVDPLTAEWAMDTSWGQTLSRTGNLNQVSAPTGTYVVTWLDLPGYEPPTNQPAVVHVETGQTYLVVGTYRSTAAGIFRFTQGAAIVGESEGAVTVSVARVAGTVGTVIVSYTSTNGTATAGEDYGAVDGTLVFTPGATNRTFVVPIFTDLLGEYDESFSVIITDVSDGGLLGDPSNVVITVLDETDEDNDGLPNWWEVLYFGDPTIAAPGVDSDGDGLTNQEEFDLETNPIARDTDGDGVFDGTEVLQNTDPTDGEDFPTSVLHDIDGDGASDIGVVYQAVGDWYVRESATGLLLGGDAQRWGPTAIPVPGDYDGDKIADFAVYATDGKWYIRQSSTGTMPGGPLSWGPNAIPVPADYDGDGRLDAAVFAPVDGKWFIRWSSTGAQMPGGPVIWGPGSIPVPADYDGDARADLAVYAPSDGKWYVKKSSGGMLGGGAITWGPGAIPVPADYDGDRKADLAVYVPATGKWSIRKSSNGQIFEGGPIAWGASVAMPVVGDYDGDGRADLAVYASVNRKWYVRRSSNGQLLGGGSSVQDGIAWGHPVVTPMPIAYQTLKAMGVVP